MFRYGVTVFLRRLPVVILAVVLVACAEGTDTSPVPTEGGQPPPSPSATSGSQPVDQAPTTGPEAVIAMLDDPDQMDEGVRLLLSEVGIGLYAADGTPIAPGSERSADDFIVYDFQIPALGAMHRGRPWTFDDLATLFSQLGIDVNSDALLEAYRQAYQERNEFLPEFVLTSGLDFTEDTPTFTPLSAWLMILDALVPPRPDVESGTRVISVASPSCNISGRAPSGWGFVAGAAADFADLVVADDVFRALNAVTLAESMFIDADATAPVVHEGHGSPGDETTLTASLVAYWQPTPVAVTCGYLTAWPITGELAGSPITWSLPAEASLHGKFESPSQIEYSSPSPSELVYQARREPGDGEGPLTEVSLRIALEADPKAALADHGVDAATLALMRPVTGELVLGVEFHGELWHFEMSDSYEGELGGVVRNWQGRFRVDDGRLEGDGIVEVTGWVLCLDTQTDIPFAGEVPFEVSGVATETELVVNLQHGQPKVFYTEEVPGLCADPSSIAYMDQFDIEQLAYEDLEVFNIVYPEALAFPRDGGEKTITSLFGDQLDAVVSRITG